MDNASPKPRNDNQGYAGPASGPASDQIEVWSDQYFLKTKATVAHFGDVKVTYAIFMRRPVISAPRLALDWLRRVAAERDTEFEIDLQYDEGRWVGAGEPIMYVSGSFVHLADLETLLLMKLGPACVAAFNAFTMLMALMEAKPLTLPVTQTIPARIRWRHPESRRLSKLMAANFLRK